VAGAQLGGGALSQGGGCLARSRTCGNCLRALPHRRRLLKAVLSWAEGGERVVSGWAPSRTGQRLHWAAGYLEIDHMHGTHLLEAAEACKALLLVTCCICVSLCNCRKPRRCWHACYAFCRSIQGARGAWLLRRAPKASCAEPGLLLCCLQAVIGNLIGL
jgi:hypothetical protein